MANPWGTIRPVVMAGLLVAACSLLLGCRVDDLGTEGTYDHGPPFVDENGELHGGVI